MNNQAAALIVHDIKNALAILEGELHALSREPERERAARAWRSCGALREKMVGFLTLYKASTSGLQVRVEAVSPADFLKGWLADTLHVRDDVRVELETGDMPPLAFFDEYLVGLALDAALQNAMRFAATAVVVGCRAGAPTGVVFSVRDDGPGPDAAGSGNECSTGLGTELCRVVAAAHHRGERPGTCRLANGAGGGALFELYLP